MTQNELDMFKATGFFDEKPIAVQHIKDFSEILNKQNTEYCVIFRVLLGLLRHQDFILWDVDMDFVIFEYEKFLEQCQPELEERGYIIEPDIRNGKNSGCRIFHKGNQKTKHNPKLGCPWIGIIIHEIIEDNSISFPPEDVRYDPEEFFLLQKENFLGAAIKTPVNPAKVLNTYFGEEDWMEYCMPSMLDHRLGCSTNFPQKYFRLNEIMEFLKK